MEENTTNKPDLGKFIGTKIILSGPMDKKTFEETIMGKEYPENTENANGYYVKYPDGYESWSPKSAFENAYRRISGRELELINS